MFNPEIKKSQNFLLGKVIQFKVENVMFIIAFLSQHHVFIFSNNEYLWCDYFISHGNKSESKTNRQ